MNRTTVRLGGATLLAALLLGIGGTAAQARTSTPERPPATVTTVERQRAIQSLAEGLLNSPVRFSAAERSELESIATGQAALTGKFDGFIKLLKKVPGFAKAVGGKFEDFNNWYNGLSWIVKAPLQVANVGANLYGIWEVFH
ncbi:hypothetical protein ACFVZ3_01630 [Kitasatospora purpeofusca]|uniref:hypothetical protein n=1 Tax=Kitasatospora purpeofusca TaxID=67352 RepID=UPI0036A4C762|nr:hypothetical protein KPHV_17570 [Kitasatospora purpeofusca]